MSSKAHSAAINRIVKLYQGMKAADHDLIDVLAGDKQIAVETSATLETSVSRLLAINGLRYIAVTNKESLIVAEQLCAGTPLGLIDSRGRIVKEATESSAPP